MPIPEALQKAWDEANLLTESGDPKGALVILRSEAWDACENGAQKARTLCFAGDAGTVLGEADAANQKRHWRRAHKNYGKALNFDAKDKETRRSMNKLASMMDEKSISLGVGLQMFDEGNPTPFGLLTILIAGMLVLVAFKVVTDWFGESADNPVVRLEISYMPDGASERTTVFIEIELYQEEAPLHVENFLLLVEDFRYDFTTFHRVIDGFMIQGGDMENRDGTGGYTGKWYGYCDGQEFDNSGNRYGPETCDLSDWSLPGEHTNGLKHVPGALAAAHAGLNTDSSQFYIVPGDSTPSHLDWEPGKDCSQESCHTVYGRVVSGLEHVTAISEVQTESGDKPVTEVQLIHVTVNE
ncbi:MAG TPA: peptidylprolyl isomerase [Candidatus Poseidoniales archaeon]|nr:peptidylprolyl isomerase [Candidatus Poseidoniales archaeon]